MKDQPLARNLPVLAFVIMIGACIYADLSVAREPRLLLTKIPIILIVAVYTLIINIKPSPRGGGGA